MTEFNQPESLESLEKELDLGSLDKSKDGYLKPKIRVKPVKLCGATITFVTVHNELYRRNNGIDVGAVVEIIRSGDVIPKVHNVLTPVEIQPKRQGCQKWKLVGLEFEHGE